MNCMINPHDYKYSYLGETDPLLYGHMGDIINLGQQSIVLVLVVLVYP